MKEQPETVTFSFEHWDTVEMDPFVLLNDATAREMWWSWDSAYAFLSRLGLRITESNLQPMRTTNGSAFLVEIKAVLFESGNMGGKLKIPWGRKAIVVNRATYERWLTWGDFRNQGELEGLGWNLLNEGERDDGRFILKMAFRIQLRYRGLKRLILTALRTPARR
jgi:hypothetical protein